MQTAHFQSYHKEKKVIEINKPDIVPKFIIEAERTKNGGTKNVGEKVGRNEHTQVTRETKRDFEDVINKCVKQPKLFFSTP